MGPVNKNLQEERAYIMRNDLCCKEEAVSGQKQSKWRFSWWMHLVLFASFQVVFMLFDGSEIWIVLGMNELGEWFISEFHVLFDWFQLYHTEQLNYVTVVWGGALIIHGAGCALEKLLRKDSHAVR